MIYSVVGLSIIFSIKFADVSIFYIYD